MATVQIVICGWTQFDIIDEFIEYIYDSYDKWRFPDMGVPQIIQSSWMAMA